MLSSLVKGMYDDVKQRTCSQNCLETSFKTVLLKDSFLHFCFKTSRKSLHVSLKLLNYCALFFSTNCTRLMQLLTTFCGVQYLSCRSKIVFF